MNSEKTRICAKGALLVLSLAAISASSYAQSSASSQAGMYYSFSIDPNSAAYGQYLSVTDLGLETYNLVNYGGYAYTSMSGSGYGTAAVDPATYFDDSNWSGYSGAGSSAGVLGTTGTGIASVGSQESLELTNFGSYAIQLDISALAVGTGDTSIAGPGDTATEDTYLGIFAFNVDTGWSDNPLVALSGSGNNPTGVSYTSDWTPFSYNNETYYSGSYDLILAPGDTYSLAFYTSGVVNTSAGASSVPGPAGMVPMLAGLIGLAAKRRKQSR
jgi:hypothetical protein